MNIKLMLAGVVGYLLGRLKKGKAALKFALWAGGRDTHVKDLVRAQVVRLLGSEEGKKLVSQLRGPLLDTARQTAQAMIERRVASLAQNLSSRTSELRHSLDEKPVSEAGGLVGSLTGSLSDAFSHWGARRGGEPKGAESKGAESKGPEAESPEAEGAEAKRAETGGAETERAETGGAETEGGQAAAEAGQAEDRERAERQEATRPPAGRVSEGPLHGGRGVARRARASAGDRLPPVRKRPRAASPHR